MATRRSATRTSSARKRPSQSQTPALWKCPKCGVKLVARNLSHSCGDFSIQKFLASKSPRGCALFDRFVSLIAACGPYEVAPAKTRVAFMTQVRFASVNRVASESIDVHFVLPRGLQSTRFRRVEQLGKLYVHHLRLVNDDDFDQELAAWLRMSYEEYGQRGWLATKASR